MKELINDLIKYKPYNEEEAKDKDQIISFINNNKDVLLRDNKTAHLTASAWIVNEQYDSVLMVYHNIFNSWSWVGGHADGDDNLFNVAIREAKEETGVKNIIPLNNTIFSVEVLTVDGHYKKGEYVSSHLHLNITYLFVVNSSEILKIKADENSGVRWINFKDLCSLVSEKWMYDHVYKKLMDKFSLLSKNYEA